MTMTPDVIIYTDGACSGNPGPGGWAALLRHPGTGAEKRLTGAEPATTNNRMELTAALRGLEALDRDRRLQVQLVSDSEYLVKGMREWLPNWRRNGWRRKVGKSTAPVKNADLWQALDAVCQVHDVTFQHVRGHAGHPENEECDRLAVAAIQELVARR